MDIEKKITEAVTDSAKELLPEIYRDGLKPTVQEVGKGLHTLSKAIHIALSPISAMVWGYERISEYVQSSLEKKLKNTPKENIISPDISIAGPTLEALRFTANKEELREMFSNLLATSMDKETVANAHPSFVEIIKQLSPLDAQNLLLFKSSPSYPLGEYRVKSEDGFRPILTNVFLANKKTNDLHLNSVCILQ